MTTTTVIIAATPTPNGDLHAGHIAGPYLAADVYARYLRATGRRVCYTTCPDDSQTYVTVTAAQLGVTSKQLAARFTPQIKQTLESIGIQLDGFAPVGGDYRTAVQNFITGLYDTGKLETRTVRFPWAVRGQHFLIEGLVSGSCPVCLADTRGGICGRCGHPNNFDELIAPASVLDPQDTVVLRETEILVLPLERYRDRLTTFVADNESRWRPHMLTLMQELLARKLPDHPVTYPLDWGIPAPFRETPNQVLNAWVEAMPACMYATSFTQQGVGEPATRWDQPWQADADTQIVFFFGFDNTYFWALTDVALLMAYEGRYQLPDGIVCNEYYTINNSKMSTSRQNVVRPAELLAKTPRDLARFYLALTAPEYSNTNFDWNALKRTTDTGLVEPWNGLAHIVNTITPDLGVDAGTMQVSAAAQTRCATMASSFASYYEFRSFSTSRAAELIMLHVDRLHRSATGLHYDLTDDEKRAQVADLFAELDTLLNLSAPILIDLAEAARNAGARTPTVGSRDTPQTSHAFPVPKLDA